MPRHRLAHLFDPASPHATRARRRVAARACAGFGVEQIARLEGISVEQAAAILQHPVILGLVGFWAWLLGCVRAGSGAEVLEGMGRRFLELELETGNHWIANLYGRFLVLVGDPGRGLVAWVVARLERLAARNMVRQRRLAAGPRPVPEELGEAELFRLEEQREMLAAARYSGMHGGLDLRRLPCDWSRGVAASLLDQVCGVMEAAAPYIMPAAGRGPDSDMACGAVSAARPTSHARTGSLSLQPAIDEIRRRFGGWPRALLGNGARASPRPARG